MLLGKQTLLFLVFLCAFFFFRALEFGFLLAQILHHIIQIAPNPRRFLQDYACLLVNFLRSFSQFYLGH